MAINYQSSFNSGELSRKMDGRSDIDAYRNGCRTLENFFVLPQGGVERRTGTEYVKATNNGAGSASARMIPFVFSSETAYAIEIGGGYARAWYLDGNGDPQSVAVSGTTPYTESELRGIQPESQYDTMILTHPNHPPQKLTRDTTGPTFSIAELDLDLVPLLDENVTATTVTPNIVTASAWATSTTYSVDDKVQEAGRSYRCLIGHDSVTFATDLAAGDWQEIVLLDASTAIFETGHVGATYRLRHVGNGTTVLTSRNSYDATTGVDDVVNAINVSYSNWGIETKGTWSGNLWAKISYDGKKTWSDLTQLSAAGDTNGESPANLALNSPTKEKGNTWLSIRTVGITGAIQFLYRNEDDYITSTVKVTAYGSGTQVTADVLSEVPVIGLATPHWSEGAFSTLRGFPQAVAFHQNRIWFTGTEFEPATLYGSVSGDLYNFNTGQASDLGIRRVIATTERGAWLASKRFLFVGTGGDTITTKSADKSNELITYANIDTQSQSVYGSAPIKAMAANDVLLYVQKNGLKVREMVYGWEEENYKSNDLTILSEEITESGIKEAFLQKQPDQNAWNIKGNGDAALLTYERGISVAGWSRITTNGDYISGCALPSSGGEDTVWICVKRDAGYMIEVFHPRVDLDWYVDSGAKYAGGACVEAESITVGPSPDFKITVTKTNHGLADGAKIRMENVTGFDEVEGQTFTVDKINNDSFFLNTIDDGVFNYAREINDWPPAELISSGAGKGSWNGTFIQAGTISGAPAYSKDGTTIANNVFQFSGTRWDARNEFGADDYANISTSPIPPDGLWIVWDEPANPPTLSYYSSVAITGDYCLVANTLTGLDHLEGQTIQVLTDGNYVSDEVVGVAGGFSAGEVVLDGYSNSILGGLQYVSTLQPMPIEPVLADRRSQSRVKGVVKVALQLYKTVGATIGEPNKAQSNYAAFSSEDKAGEPLTPSSEQIRVFTSNSWTREKIIQVKQSTPNPMTVLSMAVWVDTGGG